MRNTIRDLLGLEQTPSWTDLGDGIACALSLIVLTAAIYLGGIAMGAHP